MNYLSSGWVGKVLHRDVNGEVVMKAAVRFSQTISTYHDVEIRLARESRQITGVSCNCIAGEGRCCSQSAGLAFKVHEALKHGFIGISCTDDTCQWNRGTVNRGYFATLLKT